MLTSPAPTRNLRPVAAGMAQALASLAPFSVAPTAQPSLAVAEGVARQIKGARVVTVRPRGEWLTVFRNKAHLVVTPLTLGELRIGDLIAFEAPQQEEMEVRRIVALPGDLPRGGSGACGPGMTLEAEPGEVWRVLALIDAG